MTEPQPTILTDILDGTVADVVAAVEGMIRDELVALYEAEQAGKTRKGVIDAVTAALASIDESVPFATTRADEIRAMIDEIEAGAIDLKAAARLHALRDELESVK